MSVITNNISEIEITDLKLILITVESKILNIKFDINTLINDILQLINKETTKNSEEISDKDYILPDDIIRIGCNYGEYISEKFIELKDKI